MRSDASSLAGARVLKEQIEAYWEARGYKIKLTISQMRDGAQAFKDEEDEAQSFSRPIYRISSAMKDGYPPKNHASVR